MTKSRQCSRVHIIPATIIKLRSIMTALAGEGVGIEVQRPSDSRNLPAAVR